MYIYIYMYMYMYMYMHVPQPLPLAMRKLGTLGELVRHVDRDGGCSIGQCLHVLHEVCVPV